MTGKLDIDLRAVRLSRRFQTYKEIGYQREMIGMQAFFAIPDYNSHWLIAHTLAWVISNASHV